MVAFCFAQILLGQPVEGGLSKNACRGEHCSPVSVCLVSKLSQKMRCCGKLTGDQWSPLHMQEGNSFDGLDSVSCCEARCGYVKKWPIRMQIY